MIGINETRLNVFPWQKFKYTWENTESDIHVLSKGIQKLSYAIS